MVTYSWVYNLHLRWIVDPHEIHRFFSVLSRNTMVSRITVIESCNGEFSRRIDSFARHRCHWGSFSLMVTSKLNIATVNLADESTVLTFRTSLENSHLDPSFLRSPSTLYIRPQWFRLLLILYYSDERVSC